LLHRFSTGFNSGLPAPTTWSFVSLGQFRHPTAIAWFSLTAGAYSNKTPDYGGIDFTLSTLTDSNLVPIVKELSYASSVTKSRRGTPYISGLKEIYGASLIMT